MTNEIKEILNPNFSVSEKYENMIETATSIIKKHLSNNEDCSKEVALAYDVKNYLPRLLDYITNLQEEKKEMKEGWQQEIYDKNEVLHDWLEDERKINILQQRIDKAVEYINKHCVNEKISKEVGYKCYTMADTNELEKIINILRGDE